MGQHPEEVIAAAKSLYLKRYKVAEIASTLNVPPRTVYQWKDVGQWDDMLANEAVIDAIARRYNLLTERENKTDSELKEMDRLFTHWARCRTLQVKEFEASQIGAGGGKGAALGGRSRRPKKKHGKIVKNDVSHLIAKDFKDKLHKHYFEYQHELRRNKHYRTRNILKSRQIGATWYFAQEAFEDACLTGDNQIFLSATRRQADVFRAYIVQIAKEKFDVDLKGKDEITLHTAHGPATLYFLSNNSKSAQSYHGHVYIDEYFWIQKFNELYKVATGMAAHKKWRRTLFSTPSVVTHEAYDLWTGDRYNKQWKKKRVEFPSSAELQQGVECPDGSWRKVITLLDAEKGGCDLFDIPQLKREYSPEEFQNLFLCKFVDSLQAVFRLQYLEACYADSEEWEDFDNNAERPFGNMQVWGGYDPSRNRDDASFVIVAPPLLEGGKFRVLARYKWVDKSYSWQAKRIEELTKKFNFTHIGVDITGPGMGVFDMIRDFFPLVTPIHYSVQSKTQLVLKAKDVIDNGRIIWDASMTDIAHAFLTIRQGTTGNNMITYSAGRTESTGHADVAWAIMHALMHEPLNSKQAKPVVAFG